MTCSRSCSHLMSELGPEHKSLGCPSSAFPTAWQSSDASEKSHQRVML